MFTCCDCESWAIAAATAEELEPFSATSASARSREMICAKLSDSNPVTAICGRTRLLGRTAPRLWACDAATGGLAAGTGGAADLADEGAAAAGAALLLD